ncbi:MAG TPA: AraC family transcriptional regulator [Gemmatimonadaceae bacterium]|jgi:AraC family transcriptional activator of mtrCDE
MKKEQKCRRPEVPPDLDNLINSLDVRLHGLAECLVSSGHRLEMGSSPNVGIHYNVVGCGKMSVSDGTTIDLVPHTLVVVPPNHSFQIEVHSRIGASSSPRSIDGTRSMTSRDGIRRFVAGTSEPTLVMICGFFSASFGQSTELFTMTAPIVERFGAGDQLDVRLKQALAELIAQEVGSGAMSAALLKQVIVKLMRRSLATPGAWVERFAMLSDTQIARAFSEMVADPGVDHTVLSLAQVACLSRSAFMARFASVMGRSPMMVLRDLRMRRAAQALERQLLSVGQVANEVGYSSRSSFVRAFRQTYGVDPSEYRSQSRANASVQACAVSPGSVSSSLN